MVSFFGVFLASTNCLFFEEGKKKINNKIDQKQNLFQHHFFPSSIKVFFPCFWVFFVFSLPMMMQKETFFANLFRDFVSNTTPESLLATGARRMLRRQSAHRCTLGIIRRSMRAFDGVERAVFGRMRDARCGCVLRFLVAPKSFLVAFFSLLFLLYQNFGGCATQRDNNKKSESGRKKTRAKETRAHLLDRGLLRGGGLLFCRRGGVDL